MSSQLMKWRNNLSSGWFKFFINIWPPFVGAGIKVSQISPDYRLVEVRIKQHWYNSNYVGTHFGGSMYAMTDPFYMLILIKNLGHDYIVWDKAAAIDFKKPGRGTLRAVFTFTPEDIAAVKKEADSAPKYIFDKPVDILNEANEVVASVVKTLYVKRKDANTM